PRATAFCIFACGLCAQPKPPRATSPTMSRTTDRPHIFRAVGFTAAPRRGRTSHKSQDWFDVGEDIFVGNLITIGQLARRVNRARTHPASSGFSPCSGTSSMGRSVPDQDGGTSRPSVKCPRWPDCVISRGGGAGHPRALVPSTVQVVTRCHELSAP